MFFILPIGVDYRTRRYPVVTFTLMGLCTLFYIITFGIEIQGEESQAWVYSNLWLIPADSHWWTYLTSMFVHADFFHLLGNMIFLFLFGACVEDLIGRARFIGFYLLSGFAADLIYLMLNPDGTASDIPMGGASGAISGCIGGFAFLLFRTRIEFKWIIFMFFKIWSGDFMLPAWLVISFWFLRDLLGMVLDTGGGGGVAFAAHVGGTVAGLGLMAIEKWRRKGDFGLSDDDEEAPAIAAQQPIRVRARARISVPAAPAPLAAETPTIHLFVDGAQTGPYTLSGIQKMFIAGTIPADALYWQEGMEDWRAAEELREPGFV